MKPTARMARNMSWAKPYELGLITDSVPSAYSALKQVLLNSEYKLSTNEYNEYKGQQPLNEA